MSNNLRVGVVGTGIFATDTHLPSYAKVALTPVACYNRTKSKAEVFAEKASIPKENVYESLESIFEAKDIDVIDALLPVQHNLDAVKLAIKNNKPIALEKPIAANLDQAREIVKLSRSTDLPIFILENWSFRSTIKLIRDELLPKIGEVVGFTYNGTGPYAAHKYINTGWRVKPVHIGGYLSDGGVHQLALLTGVLGDVESISALTRQIRETSGTVDTLFSTLKLDSGAIGTFTYGSQFGATKKNTFFTIFGTDGSITYDFSPNLPKPTVTYQTLSAPEPTVIEIDEIDTFVAEFENVIETVRSGKKEGVHVKPAEAFHHLAVIAAALESAEHNGTSVKVEKV